MNQLPQGVQEYDPKGPKRYTFCPDHNRKTTRFQGIQDYKGKTVWLFRCATPDHSPHYFIAEPDPKAPATQEAYDKWLASKQREHASLQ